MLELEPAVEYCESAPALETERVPEVLEEKPKKVVKGKKAKKEEKEKKEKKKGKGKERRDVQVEDGPIAQPVPDVLLSEMSPVEIQPAAQEAEVTLSSTRIPEEIQPQIIMHHPPSLAGQTVVLSIRTGSQVQNTMVNLAENTKTAILDAVNSYLVSNAPLGHSMKRKVEIAHGAGKNGDVDLSVLEESKWPEYLEYFRQCTVLPELQVDVEEWQGYSLG